MYRVLRQELASSRPGGRAEGTFMDGVKEDMEMVGVKEEDAQWRLDVTPGKKKRKKRRE